MTYPERDHRDGAPSRRPGSGRPQDQRAYGRTDQRHRGDRRGRDPRGRGGQRPGRDPLARPGSRGPRGRGGTAVGWRLRPQNIGFSGGRGRGGLDYRLLTVAGVIILAALIIVFSVSSCMRNDAEQKRKAAEAQQAEVRIAAGIPDELSKELDKRLTQDEQVAQIAKNADQYDPRMVQLALDEPTAVGLVAGYLSSDKTAQPYGESVEVGSYPQLYDWDSRWGDVDYAGGPLAVNGSGPTVASMAYMGLTGKNDKSPADMATIATEAGLASGDTYLDESFFSSQTNALGIVYHSYDVSADNISTLLTKGTVIAVQVKKDSLTPEAHWILLVESGPLGVKVHDPSSTEVSSRPWSAAEIAAGAKGSLYTLTKMSS